MLAGNSGWMVSDWGRQTLISKLKHELEGRIINQLPDGSQS